MENIKKNYVQQALIHEEIKHSKLPWQSNSAESALMGTKRNKSRYSPNCFRCGETGHIRRFCPKEKSRDNFKPAHDAKVANDREYRKQDSDSESGDSGAGAFTASVGGMKTDGKEWQWLIDSGASSHMTKKRDMLKNFQQFDEPEHVALGDGRVVKALGSGNVHMNMLSLGSKSKRAVLYNVLYVPKLACNLFSVRAAVAKGNVVDLVGIIVR